MNSQIHCVSTGTHIIRSLFKVQLLVLWRSWGRRGENNTSKSTEYMYMYCTSTKGWQQNGVVSVVVSVFIALFVFEDPHQSPRHIAPTKCLLGSSVWIAPLSIVPEYYPLSLQNCVQFYLDFTSKFIWILHRSTVHVDLEFMFAKKCKNITRLISALSLNLLPIHNITFTNIGLIWYLSGLSTLTWPYSDVFVVDSDREHLG